MLQPPNHQRDAGQVLAQPVVQVVADASLLLVGDLEDPALQLARSAWLSSARRRASVTAPRSR
jgi:hypothetical protein